MLHVDGIGFGVGAPALGCKGTAKPSSGRPRVRKIGLSIVGKVQVDIVEIRDLVMFWLCLLFEIQSNISGDRPYYSTKDPKLSTYTNLVLVPRR